MTRPRQELAGVESDPGRPFKLSGCVSEAQHCFVSLSHSNPAKVSLRAVCIDARDQGTTDASQKVGLRDGQ
jgi:hypothetical protein